MCGAEDENEAHQHVNSVFVAFKMQCASLCINLNEPIYLRPSVKLFC